jgi:hypothetical protein
MNYGVYRLATTIIYEVVKVYRMEPNCNYWTVLKSQQISLFWTNFQRKTETGSWSFMHSGTMKSS